jgi:hypothetical protein
LAAESPHVPAAVGDLSFDVGLGFG